MPFTFEGVLLLLHRWFGPPRSRFWSRAIVGLDAILTLIIIKRVPFTNVDWEAYMHEVSPVLRGEFDYSTLSGPTGPIAYPAGFVYFYGGLHMLTNGGGNIFPAQVVFAVLELLATLAVTELQSLAGAPGWLAVCVVLSKRCHSVFVLRLFNDGVAAVLFYVALVLYLHGGHVFAALLYSASVSVKISPILYCPAFGLLYVLHGGWSHAIKRCIIPCVLLQLLLAAPFLAANPNAYLSRAFGGPGDLQQVWSVNWKWLSAEVFDSRVFPLTLLCVHITLLLWFAHNRWCSRLGLARGLLDSGLWHWERALQPLPANAVSEWLLALFSCNFLGIICLRTLHFQYLVWYFHTLPFLAWRALTSSSTAPPRSLWTWIREGITVVSVVLLVEVCFLLVKTDRVRGPDGRAWETPGTPTGMGSFLLTLVHMCLAVALARLPGSEQSAKANKEQ